ncbi:uncharacterized protein LOC143423867 [Xylocopa sonorina]|uniref:uncharacterized protein LOC143423867 n=1 Tax=Xylocopa sonorina TaxID=1818115 RepID=UPI00403B2ECA
MRALTAEKKPAKHRSKNNHDKKKKSKDKNTGKSNEEMEKSNRKKETPKKVYDNIERILISTMDRYDSPLMWFETEPVQYAINYPPVKFRLEKVMGSHVVRLTDRKYMLLLMAKLCEDRVEQQKIRINRRKLSPPSVISGLLKISYQTLVERMKDVRFIKLQLYI